MNIVDRLVEQASLLRVPPAARRVIKKLGEPTLPIVGIVKTSNGNRQVESTTLYVGNYRLNVNCTTSIFAAVIPGDCGFKLGEEIATRQLPCSSKFLSDLK